MSMQKNSLSDGREGDMPAFAAAASHSRGFRFTAGVLRPVRYITLVVGAVFVYGANIQPAHGISPGAPDHERPSFDIPSEVEDVLPTFDASRYAPLQLADNKQSTSLQLHAEQLPESASGSPESRVEEVVVTAQRRAENLQNVPVSAEVVVGQQLAIQNLNSAEALTQTIPGVQVNPSGATNAMFIRGIGSLGNQSFDQSVGLFIDDVFHGRSRMTAATFLDLDRVEILKGPQSTFFGNNAIAGALNIVTKKPGNTFDAWARVLYGQYGTYAAEGAVGGPVTDVLDARVAVTANGVSRGWIDDVATGETNPKVHNLAGRVTLAFHSMENLEAILKVEGGKDTVDGGPFGSSPMQIFNCPPSFWPTAAFGSTCVTALSEGLPIGFGTNRNASIAGEGTALSNLENVLTINYAKWGQMLTSVTSFHNFHFDLKADGEGQGYPPGFTLTAPEKYHQFSQELRVASPTNQLIEYLAGAYIQSDTAFFEQQNTLFFVSPFFPAPSPYNPYLPLAKDLNFKQPEHSYAIFGSVSWNVTDRLKLSGGLRGSWVNKSFTQNVSYGSGTETFGGFFPLPPELESPSGFFGLGVPGKLSGDRSDHAWMPSARLQFQIDTQVMAYLSYARGFKAGGFNGLDGTGVAANLPYGPERVNGYEAGLKSEWLDDTLLVNLDVFRSDFSDLQVNTFVLGQSGAGTGLVLVRNAASSRSQGVELEGQWVASRYFHLSTNATYLDAHYISYPNAPQTLLQSFCAVSYVLPYCAAIPNPVPATTDLSGRPIAAPRWSVSVTATHYVFLPGDYKLITELDPYYTSRNQDPEPLFNLELGSYLRLDGRLGFEPANGRWGVDLIGKNLTDRIILTGLGNVYLASKQEPRNVALQFRYKW
jgi:iron complex outermembrane recepter protein